MFIVNYTLGPKSKRPYRMDVDVNDAKDVVQSISKTMHPKRFKAMQITSIVKQKYMGKKNSINPFFNEYVYACLYNVTDQEKTRLSNATIKILETDLTARRFASSASEEAKKRVLAELGYEWATVVWPKSTQSSKILKQVIAKVEAGRSALGIEHLVNEKMFITTDKQTIFMLGMAAQSLNHENYFLNLDMIKKGHYVKRWKKVCDTQHNDTALEAIESAAVLDRIIEESINQYLLITTFATINEEDLRILQYLARHQNIYVAHTSITANFIGTMPDSTVGNRLRLLDKNKFIRKHVYKSPQKYTITGSGLDIVMKFRNRVLAK